MKRYMLFAGNDYYPKGGAFDFISDHETIEEAIKAHDPTKFEYDGGWANIFDTQTKKIVKEFWRIKNYEDNDIGTGWVEPGYQF